MWKWSVSARSSTVESFKDEGRPNDGEYHGEIRGSDDEDGLRANLIVPEGD